MSRELPDAVLDAIVAVLERVAERLAREALLPRHSEGPGSSRPGLATPGRTTADEPYPDQ